MDHLQRMLALGFRFAPSAEELITYYLPRLVAGQSPLGITGCIHRADVYGGEPRDLAGRFPPLHGSELGERFFFSTCKRQKGSSSRKSRAAGNGAWVSQTSRPAKNSAGVKIGETKVFRFKIGGKYTDWLMEEHHSCLQEAAGGGEEPVICKMYVSPRAPQDSSARQESAAFLRQEPAPPLRPPPAPEPTKRPAPPVAEPPPCAKKMRVAAVSARPLPQAHQSCAAAFAPLPPPPPPPPPQAATSSTPSMPRRVMAPRPTPMPARSSAVEAPPPAAPATAQDITGSADETQAKECGDDLDQFACCLEDFFMDEEEENHQQAEAAAAADDCGDNEMGQMDGTLLSRSEEAENDGKLQDATALGVPAAIDGQCASSDDFLASSEVDLADIADWLESLPEELG